MNEGNEKELRPLQKPCSPVFLLESFAVYAYTSCYKRVWRGKTNMALSPRNNYKTYRGYMAGSCSSESMVKRENKENKLSNVEMYSRLIFKL